MSVEVLHGRRPESPDDTYEEFSVSSHQNIGRFGLRVYSPTQKQMREKGLPKVVVPYTSGWAQGLYETNTICERLAREAHVYTVSAKLPEGEHDIDEMVPFRADVLHATIDVLQKDITYDLPIFPYGYSRGSAPNAVVAGDRPHELVGAGFIAPTWFSKNKSALQLLSLGVTEGIESLTRGSLRDRWGLIRIGRNAGRELATHPWEYRRDVFAISKYSRPEDLVERLSQVPRIAVVAGRRDKLCPAYGIVEVAQQLQMSNFERPVDLLELDVSHLQFFDNVVAMRGIANQIQKSHNNE